MCEEDLLAVDLEDSGLDRLGQAGLRPSAGSNLDLAYVRVGERGNDPRHLQPGSAQAIDALVNELVQARGKGQLLARQHPAASSLKRARQLEGEERISRRRLPDPQESRSGKDGVAARSQQLVERTDAEGAELDSQKALVRHGADEPRRHLVASRQDCDDRFGLQPW